MVIMLYFSLKADDGKSSKPENFLERYEDDVDLAYQEYESAVAVEDQAKKQWRRRIELAESTPANPSAEDTELLKENIEFFRKRFKDRQKYRQKRKKDLDKRLAAREKAKSEIDQTIEKRENWVYREGDNYTIRWSALPK